MVIGAVIVHTLIAFITDIRTRRIPNLWNFAVCMCGFIYHFAIAGWRGLGFSLTGALVLFVLTGLLYAIRAIGGGDVKWFAALGAWSGWAFSLSAFLYTMFLAGLLALLLFMIQGRLFKLLRSYLQRVVVIIAHRKLDFSLSTHKPMSEIPLMIAGLPAVMLAMHQGLEGWWV